MFVGRLPREAAEARGVLRPPEGHEDLRLALGPR